MIDYYNNFKSFYRLIHKKNLFINYDYDIKHGFIKKSNIFKICPHTKTKFIAKRKTDVVSKPQNALSLFSITMYFR